MNDLLTRALELRSINATTRTADFVASTDAVDSYGEIVEQIWDLKRYAANPVVLYSHNSRDLPIGTSTRCEVVRGALECTIQFCTEDMNPMAEQVWKMVQAKVLRGVSVGFLPNTVRFEKRNGQDICILSDNELHEISVTPVPANHEALAKMKAKAMANANTNTTQETIMNENELKALLATRESDLVKAQALVISAEAKVTAAETKAASLETRSAELTTELKAEMTARGAIEAKLMTVTTERDAAIERSAALEATVIERDVEALIGVKIDAAQKESFLAFAKKDRASFDSVIKSMPDKKLLDQIVAREKTDARPPVNGASTGDDLAVLMNENATQ